MADAAESHNIARHAFGVARRGYEQQEVRGYLHEVQALVDRLHREVHELRERADRAEARLDLADGPDDAMLLEVLGEETTRVLTSAREAAGEIRTKAEAAAERIVSDATHEASETRAQAMQDAERRLAEATAEHERLVTEARTELDRRQTEAQEAGALIKAEAAEQAQALRDEGQRDLDRMRDEAEQELAARRAEGKQMVAEAQAVRERVLRDLAARRKKARQQVEKLNAARERLLEAYAVVRRTIDVATDELSSSLSDARLAGDAAARRIEEEPDTTLEQLDDEVRTAGLVDLPVAEHHDAEPDDDAGHDDASSGPRSGEVPAVEERADEHDPSGPAAEVAADPARLGERRGRKRRKRESFEGLPAGELVRLEPPVEGEGVRVLDQTEEPPPVEAEVEPEPDEAAAEQEPDAEEPDPKTGADGGSPVDDLFARLRADQGDASRPDEPADSLDPAGPPIETADADADADADATAPPAPSVSTPFTERDALLEPIDKELGRRLKRALANEQNEVLDLLRRAKPRGVDDLLPVPDEHAARWIEVVKEVLSDAAAAGAGWAGGQAESVADLAEELAESLTAPLRERIDRSFSAADGNLDDVADRVRALYREWKGTRLTDTSRHYAAAAYAHGVFDATKVGARVHWVVDPAGRRCPDCDDNVLGAEIEKGTEFPTGHTCAPAHPGCRCLVLATDR
ncbi:MAG: DivIVA domain-containing protein [Acidimicrobiales bacterium]